jgi:hypothetical protein
VKRLPAVRIHRVRAKKAESSGHRLFVLLDGASRAVVGDKLCSTGANYVDGEITISACAAKRSSLRKMSRYSAVAVVLK